VIPLKAKLAMEQSAARTLRNKLAKVHLVHSKLQCLLKNMHLSITAFELRSVALFVSAKRLWDQPKLPRVIRHDIIIGRYIRCLAVRVSV
jgi:hypothetical protein